MSRRRVVVTGLGIVSPVGSSIEKAWANIIAGKSGISKIDCFDFKFNESMSKSYHGKLIEIILLFLECITN